DEIGHVLELTAELEPRALFELTDALFAHAELGAELLERRRIFGHEACAHDHALALVEHVHGGAYGASRTLGSLVSRGDVLRRRPIGGEAIDERTDLGRRRVEARFARGENGKEELHAL